ncbi:MAG TPA: pectin acetylesterase-family hydrolase [Candidatus Binatia bacterium]
MTSTLRTTVLGLSLVLVAGATGALSQPAHAREAYPANRCVSVKQREAGKYCRAVLKAWSRYAASGDAVRRAADIAAAADKLSAFWAKADADAASQASDCADTTLDVAAAVAAIDAGVDQVVAAVEEGLNLDDRKQASCARKLLEQSGELCRKLLRAESQYIARPARDAGGKKRAAAQERASTAFGRAVSRFLAGPSCPSTTTSTELAELVTSIAQGIRRDTVISPKVDDARFTTISPTGTTPYLGRGYKAVCMNGSPYHFFVKRGSVNKVLMYYQGGGACWEQLTCSVPVCDTSVNPNGSDNPNNQSSGFADRSNPQNPFRDWHIVFVSYCSCDIHFGDAAQDYPLHVEHRGYQNARIVEKWAREHFLDPEEVFVTGSSAGAYGAWFHAPLLHEVWPNAEFNVLADAGNGVVTQQFMRDYFPNWNFEANIPRNIPGLRDVLFDGSGIPGYTEIVARRFPETKWAHYTTAFDGGTGGQTGFYAVMLADSPIAGVTWWTASCPFNAQMRVQALATAAALPNNYRYYIGTGSRHTMWGTNRVYTDTTGGVPRIVDWVNAMRNSTPANPDPLWTNVECTNCGLLLSGDPRPSPLQAPFKQVGADVVIDCEAP